MVEVDFYPDFVHLLAFVAFVGLKHQNLLTKIGHVVTYPFADIEHSFVVAVVVAFASTFQ